MIRVLQMIGSLNIGGSQAMIMNIYRKINKRKVQFDFIVDHGTELYYADEIKKLGGKIFIFPTFKGSNILNVVQYWNKFFREHPEYKVLHSHVRSYATIYLPIAKKYGVKTIIHSHSTSNGKGLSSIVKLIMQYPLRYQADYLFSCSKEAGEWLFGKKAIKSNRYYMIRNAIDSKIYCRDDRIRKKYRQQLGISDDESLYIHVGRLHEAKNHVFLLNVFRAVLNKEKKSKLILVGNGDLYKFIKSEIQKLKISENVIMLGARNDVAELLISADYFLFPSKWEGLPVTVVEAQAAGLPCYVSNNITRDVNVSKLVRNISIDDGIEPWVKEIIKHDMHYEDVSNEIIESGFDIGSSVRWITNFYEGISI